MPTENKKVLFILLSVIVGWIFNLISAIFYNGEVTDPLYMLRLIGIVIVPIGAILGYYPNTNLLN